MNDLKQVILDALEEYNSKTSNAQSEYMDRDEAMDYLHVSRVTLWRYEKEGLLEPKKVRKKILYKRTNVERLFC